MKKACLIVIAAALLLLPACSNSKSSGGGAPSSGESTGAGGGTSAKKLGAAAGGWQPKAGDPLAEPAEAVSSGGVLNVELTAALQTISVAGSPLKGLRTLNGKLGGPTLRVHPGDTIKVTFINNLPNAELTNIHYHGLHVDPNGISDNIFRKWGNGKYTSEVHLPPDHPTGTFWYHAHYHTNSEQQVMGGYSGMLIVEGLEKLLPPDLQGITQRQLGLRDVQTTGDRPSDGTAILPNQILISPNAPSTRLVNSQYQPTFSMKSNQYELWRVANLGADVFYRVQFQDHDFAVIAEDGVPVWRLTKQSELLIAPGKRFDVLVLGGKAGKYLLQSLPYAQVSKESNGDITPQPVPLAPATLATVTVEPSSEQVPPLPAGLVPEDDLTNATIVTPSPPPFVFSYTKNPSQPYNPFHGLINDKAFTDDMVPLAAPVVDTVEEWTLQNTTNDDHPFHIHVNGFQVMKVNGDDYHANGHQDTVNIPKRYKAADGTIKNGEVVIRSRFSTFTGWFVFHCHILNHEDAGMMATVQVRPSASTPITPPPPTPDPPIVSAHEHETLVSIPE